MKAATLVDDLQNKYHHLPKHVDEDDYAIINVAPSVRPTYLPAYRIWSYNVTTSSAARYQPHASAQILATGFSDLARSDDEDDNELEDAEEFDLLAQSHSQHVISSGNGDVEELRKKHKKKRRRRKKKPAKLPRHVSPISPSRTNRRLSLLGYIQYYLPLSLVNENDGWGPQGKREEDLRERPLPAFDVEYTTFSESTANELSPAGWKDDTVSVAKHKHNGTYYYNMPDLTIGSWLRLAKSLSKDSRHWEGYRKRMFVSSGV